MIALINPVTEKEKERVGEERGGEVFGFMSIEEWGVLVTASNSCLLTPPSSIRDQLCSDSL